MLDKFLIGIDFETLAAAVAKAKAYTDAAIALIPIFDPTTISGYDATKVQVLTNNLGTLTWAEGTTYASLNNTQYGGNQ